MGILSNINFVKKIIIIIFQKISYADFADILLPKNK